MVGVIGIIFVFIPESPWCIAAWPKITQHLVDLSVFNTYGTYFCEYCGLHKLRSKVGHPSIVQYAGNKNPLLVTVILSCVQIISVVITAGITDNLGRRPFSVYPLCCGCGVRPMPRLRLREARFKLSSCRFSARWQSDE